MLQRAKLKLTGYRNADELEDIFASQMIDVAYLLGVVESDAFLIADDPEWPQDEKDYEWLCTIIKGTLAEHGMSNIQLTYIPET